MRKLLMLLVAVFLMNGIASASDDKPIDVSQLPQLAQKFIKTHFASTKVSYAMVEKSMFGNEYKVVFDNANKVEFDKNGAWTDLECKDGGVPVAIVPAAIQSYVMKNHPKNKVLKMDKGSLGYEITLSNGLELKFDPKFKFLKYDD